MPEVVRKGKPEDKGPLSNGHLWTPTRVCIQCGSLRYEGPCDQG